MEKNKNGGLPVGEVGAVGELNKTAAVRAQKNVAEPTQTAVQQRQPQNVEQLSQKDTEDSKKALHITKIAQQSLKKVSLSKKTSQSPLAPDKLTLLITVVNREKGEYFLDLLQSFGNLQLAFAAVGTAAKTFGLLAPETEKTVIFSVVTQENAKSALAVLQEKFVSIRQGKGVAFSVPMTCTIGVAIYKFLCNKEG